MPPSLGTVPVMPDPRPGAEAPPEHGALVEEIESLPDGRTIRFFGREPPPTAGPA